MKNWFLTEYEKLSAIDSSGELYRIYFRLSQLCSLLSLAWCLFFVAPMMAEIQAIPEMAPSISRGWFLSMSLFPLGQILIAEICVRKMRAFPAVLVGLVLALLMIPSIAFPVGLLGLYSLLNKQFQQSYLVHAPRPFREILSALKINYVDPVDAPV